MTKKKQELPPERPPDEPTNLAEWLWRVKLYEGSIYVRELDNSHWKTIALGCLPPKEWVVHVARMLEAGILPIRIRGEVEK